MLSQPKLFQHRSPPKNKKNANNPSPRFFPCTLFMRVIQKKRENERKLADYVARQNRTEQNRTDLLAVAKPNTNEQAG